MIYTNESDAVETLNLIGSPTVVPEPGSALRVAGGLVGMALRRRSRS